MNVIVSNKLESVIGSVEIDVIKTLNGVFSVDDLAATFKSFFYNKMILDVTALKDYENIQTMQQLTLSFDMSKIILVLDDSPIVNSAAYLSTLVSLGIYNFTKSADNIPFLINNPNSYKDVARFHQLNGGSEDISDAFNQSDISNTKDPGLGQRVIGVKNVTLHAGATTLTYLLKKHCEKSYKAKAVEIGEFDFGFFNDDGLDYIPNDDLKGYIDSNKDAEVIFVDLTVDSLKDYCTEVIYLVEPGLIPLNRLVKDNPSAFVELNEQKVILNKSVLSDKDVTEFEKEAKTKIFYNMPYIDDKVDDSPEIKALLAALGFTRFGETPEKPKGGFSLFH